VVVVRDREVLFAKNSDRDPNEAQILEWHPRREHASNDILACTWKVIPQARRTWATMLSRPYWMWGAEMGANEHNVVIGNEAVFTHSGAGAADGLLGMDLLRLALERAQTADEAAAVITRLLIEHGQGGRCGYDDPSFRYDNSFLIADPNGAIVLETSGRDTAEERVREGVRAISNGLTIPPFAAAHTDQLRTTVARAPRRKRRMERLCQHATTVADMARALRDHGDHGHGAPKDPVYSAVNGAMSAPCMHAGGLIANSQTVSSWVASLTPVGARHFATATSTPCLSGFKPIAIEAPRDLGAPTGIEDGQSVWWRFERLHRAVIGDPLAMAAHRAARDAWESATWNGTRKVDTAFEEWDAFIASAPPAGCRDERPAIVRRFWQARVRDASAHAPKLPPHPR
jgi:dipeptidase